jgi:hypothetical protein
MLTRHAVLHLFPYLLPAARSFDLTLISNHSGHGSTATPKGKATRTCRPPSPLAQHAVPQIALHPLQLLRCAYATKATTLAFTRYSALRASPHCPRPPTSRLSFLLRRVVARQVHPVRGGHGNWGGDGQARGGVPSRHPLLQASTAPEEGGGCG